MIELRVSGDYEALSWNKGNVFGNIPGLMEPQEVPNFYEIFTRDSTTAEDMGLYIVTPQFMASYTQVPSTRIDFKVIPPGTYSVFLTLFMTVLNVSR